MDRPVNRPGRAAYLTAMISLASAAFGVVAALAWNKAVSQLFKVFMPKEARLVGLFVYAIIVTVIAVFVMVNLANAIQRLQE